MATIKLYSDLQQSKVLAGILPLESADIYYKAGNDDQPTFRLRSYGHIMSDKDVCAWSLTALLELLDYPQLSKDKLGSGKEGWMVSVYQNDCRYDSYWHDNPVDACYEMIIRLNELNLL